MEINLAKTAGFCFGVKRAIKMALETAEKDTSIEMLGDIVHNEEVIKQVSGKGIQKVSKISSGKEKTLIIRAHGAEKQIFEDAEKLGYSIVDATCPMVTEIHNIVKKMENNGYKIIIIGDENHAEVKGIAGQLSEKPFIISSKDSIPYQ
jgi:4-hydroxy-3-methylbut-2-en-1-yl diphosphate reductase